MKVDFEHENMSEEEMIRELSNLNNKLLEAERVKTDFLSNIKNEINNPMTSILGLLKMMISKPEDHDGNMNKTKLIYNEVHNLNFQIQNVIIAAEIEAGHFEPEVSLVSIKALMDELMHLYDDVCMKKNIKFDWHHTGEEKIKADREKVHIIISNLISNATKFSPKDSEIKLNTSMEDGKLSVEIKDTGKGIAEDQMAEIFDRFKQLESGTKKSFGGHGLGLSIVHALVDIMNGELFIDSKVGEGTTLKFSIPEGESHASDVDLFGDDDAIFFDSMDDNDEVF